MQSQLRDGDTNQQTADKVGCCKEVVVQTKKKQAYRDVVLAYLAEKQYSAKKYADDLIKKTTAQKTMNIDGEAHVVDDNPVQMTAITEIGDIYGVKAPKQVDLKHSMAAMSDDELQEEVRKSQEEFDGRLQHQITGAPNVATIITNAVAVPEPAVVGASTEQTVAPAND